MKATKKRKDLSAIEKFKIIQILEEKSKSRSHFWIVSVAILLNQNYQML
jgi:hypothetical protein